MDGDKIKGAFMKVKKDFNKITNELEKTKGSKKNFEIEIVKKLGELSVYLKEMENNINKKAEGIVLDEYKTVTDSKISELKNEMIEEIAKVYDRMYNEFVEIKTDIKQIKEELNLAENKPKKKQFLNGLFSKKEKKEEIYKPEVLIKEIPQPKTIKKETKKDKKIEKEDKKEEKQTLFNKKSITKEKKTKTTDDLIDIKSQIK